MMIWINFIQWRIFLPLVNSILWFGSQVRDIKLWDHQRLFPRLFVDYLVLVLVEVFNEACPILHFEWLRILTLTICKWGGLDIFSLLVTELKILYRLSIRFSFMESPLTLTLRRGWHDLTIRNAFKNIILALLKVYDGRVLSYLFQSCQQIVIALVVWSHLLVHFLTNNFLAVVMKSLG